MYVILNNKRDYLWMCFLLSPEQYTGLRTQTTVGGPRTDRVGSFELVGERSILRMDVPVVQDSERERRGRGKEDATQVDGESLENQKRWVMFRLGRRGPRRVRVHAKVGEAALRTCGVTMGIENADV